METRNTIWTLLFRSVQGDVSDSSRVPETTDSRLVGCRFPELLSGPLSVRPEVLNLGSSLESPGELKKKDQWWGLTFRETDLIGLGVNPASNSALDLFSL